MFFRLRHALLMAEPAGGGGGAAGGLTPELRDEITTMMGTTVNNMLSARLKTFEKQLHDKLGGTIGEALKAQLPDILKQTNPEPVSDGKDGKASKNDRESVALQTLQRQLEEQRARSDAFEAKANQERATRRQGALAQSVSQALSIHGIEGNRARAALALLKNDNRIGFESDDEDNIVFRGEDGIGVALDVGLRQWAKSEEARVFMPPSNTRGSGSRPNGQSPGSSVSKEEATAMFWESVGGSIRSTG